MHTRRNYYFYLNLLLAILVSFSALFVATNGRAAKLPQSTAPSERAEEMLERLTPEERIGQLFLVTFYGPEAGAGSQTGIQIYDLIVNHHIGGIVLKASNDNFLGFDQTIPIARGLIDQLQRNEYTASQSTQVNPQTNASFRPAYIPLFIGLQQEGGGYPYDQILNGLTTLPSQMAIGATWQPGLAQQVGEVLGNELAALGVNLLLGPSMDVLESPYSESSGDLGVRSYGGDPFWVGEMGRAYIRGVHEGSNNQIAVVATHFPGFGSSDRLPEEEVATVRKSLEQLKQIELAPFFAITGNAPDELSTTDALLTSHIRYQGFQGNIRATTKPISFDPQAFSQLIQLPAFATWRANGGLMISDNLGSRAVRRFYDPTGQTFSARFVARDAFLTGNDLLYVDNFVSSGDEDQYTTILRTLEFFTQKYREDTAFAQRVDESVLRILSLKYRIYGNTFSLSQTLPPENAIAQLGLSSQVTFDVARQSATLISPSLDELDENIPDPPGRNDRILFISDTRLYQQCSICRLEFDLSVNSFANAVIRLYSGSGQVLTGNLTSYTFDDLQAMLDAGTGVVELENDIRAANWIVVAMQDFSANNLTSLALRRFLDERPDLIQQKRLIVFALSAPYYLDATDISKLTAYYALYSRSDEFIEVAARLLFQEIQPSGDLPISVPGVGYDLNQVTFPDPNQVIPLFFDDPQAEIALEGTETPMPTLQAYKIGDTVNVRTGVITDYNGRPVPDGTIVRFIVSNNGSGTATQQVETQTTQGIAWGSIRIDLAGVNTIRAESDPAKSSEILTIDIPILETTATIAPPTPTPSETPTETIEPSVTPSVTVTQPPPPIEAPPSGPNFGYWFLSLLVIALVGTVNYGVAAARGWQQGGIRAGFLAVICGLLVYTILVAGFPRELDILQEFNLSGLILSVLAGAISGAVVGWIWWGVDLSRAR
jgi:beta-N-acetylhexosaminidase